MRGLSHVLVCVPLALGWLGCMPVAALERVDAAPTARERAMLEDYSDGKLDTMSDLEAALVVGGPRDPAQLAAAARALDERLNRIVAGLGTRERGRALLWALFTARNGRPFLGSYDATATTLYDVVTTGRYNCVSATMVYVLAAERAGIDARPVLLPSHARADVVLGDRTVIVETTTPDGFDPPAKLEQQVIDRARPKRASDQIDLYADEKGTEVSFSALLAAAYGNLGIWSQERGDTVLASSLVSREAALTPAEVQPLVRMQQMALMTELATRHFEEGRLNEAMRFARQAYDASPDERTRRLAEQNITAIGSRYLHEHAAELDDAHIAAFPERLRDFPHAYGDVRAQALTMLSQRRLQRGDVDGSAAALRDAASSATSRQMRGLTERNATLGELNRLGTLSTSDPNAAWDAFQKLGPMPPDTKLAEIHRQVGAVIAENRSIRFANTGQCDRLDASLAEMPMPMPGRNKPDALRASCHARSAHALADKGDYAGAAKELRDARRLAPGEQTYRMLLASMLARQISPLLNAGRCDDARPLVDEGRALVPDERFFLHAASYCAAK